MSGTQQKLFAAALLWTSLIGCGEQVKVRAEGPESFAYFEGKPVPKGIGRRHEIPLRDLQGTVYVYATLNMGPKNPLLAGDRQGQQSVVLGHMTAQQHFVPVVRFGLGDAFETERNSDESREGLSPSGGASVKKKDVLLVPCLSAGSLDYFAGYARPETPYDFRLQLDLNHKRLTVWSRGRGDQGWFLLAEGAPLTAGADSVNHLRVEQYPESGGIQGFKVQNQPWPEGESIRAHPLAKKGRIVRIGEGFHFQSVRSTWQIPGRHVAVSRKLNEHHAFGDVAFLGGNRLVAAWTRMSHSGGPGGVLIAHSGDLGKTWTEGVVVQPGSRGCVRIQKLRDGKLLLITDVAERKDYRDVVMYDSADDGRTWSKPRWIRATRPDTGGLYEPSRILELADGTWLVATSSYGGTPMNITVPSYVEVYKSTDRGQNWTFFSKIAEFPPHHLTEPSLISLPDGRLLLFAREWRYDGLPGVKAFSADGGKSWKAQNLPFSVTGRVCAGLLADGRAMITFRSGIGRAALWAWIGDPDDATGFEPGGAHFNDSQSVGLKEGDLHIDNDGRLGQFTQYFLYPADTPQTKVDFTAEVKVVSNSGRAATLSVPWVGKLKIFPDHIELAHDTSVNFKVSPGSFHTYRVVHQSGKARIFVDGKLRIETDRIDARPWRGGAFQNSVYPASFGNESADADAHTNVYAHDITTEITGYSIWKRVEQHLEDPITGKRTVSWSAASGRFPDQYQLDHIVEVEATTGGDQGYSGWVQLADGRIFVVNYTDDTAPLARWDPYDGGVLGIPWMRGTFLLPSDIAAQ